MHSLHGYGMMLDDPRAELYAEALRRSVRPGSVVVDLGAGTGIWTMYACALGARRVFAIEPGDVISLAIDAAKANGFLDRITFIQRDSSRARIDEPADVVVADIRGVLPTAERGVTGMMDARRWLAPGGVLIPRRDTLFVAVVHAPAAYAARVGPWETRAFGLDFSAARRAALSVPRKERFEPGDLVTPFAAWAELDYLTQTDPSVSGHVTLAATRPQTAHGLVVWFESDLIDGIHLSNRPGDPPLIYGQAFLPWPAPVLLAEGTGVEVRLRAAYTGSGYFINWDTRISDGPAGRERVRFAQSTLDGLPLSLATLQRGGADAVVVPGPEVDIERFVLDAFDGVRSQGEIAAALLTRCPGRFRDHAEALARVADISLRLLANGDEPEP